MSMVDYAIALRRMAEMRADVATIGRARWIQVGEGSQTLTEKVPLDEWSADSMARAVDRLWERAQQQHNDKETK